MTAYSPLGSPDRPGANTDSDPVVLNNPVLQKIADKHKTTIALVCEFMAILFCQWANFSPHNGVGCVTGGFQKRDMNAWQDLEGM